MHKVCGCIALDPEPFQPVLPPNYTELTIPSRAAPARRPFLEPSYNSVPKPTRAPTRQKKRRRSLPTAISSPLTVLRLRRPALDLPQEPPVATPKAPPESTAKSAARRQQVSRKQDKLSLTRDGAQNASATEDQASSNTTTCAEHIQRRGQQSGDGTAPLISGSPRHKHNTPTCAPPCPPPPPTRSAWM